MARKSMTEALENKNKDLISKLAECYRASGADTDGDEEWRYAAEAPRAVRELRSDYDEACDEIVKLKEANKKQIIQISQFIKEAQERVQRLEKAEEEIASLRLQKRNLTFRLSLAYSLMEKVTDQLFGDLSNG